MEELLVVASLLQAASQEFHGLGGGERVQYLTEYPGALEIILGDEELFLTGAGTLNVDGREDALVNELSIQDDFHVAGSLEFFEDYFIHAGARVDERGGDDGE